MKNIRYYHNHNTGECKVWFGTPFHFNESLYNLPNIWNGKQVHVLGVTPYTVDLEIIVPPNKATDAYHIVNNTDDVPYMIDRLRELH